MRICLFLFMLLISVPAAQARSADPDRGQARSAAVEETTPSGAQSAAAAEEAPPSFQSGETQQWSELSKFIDIYQPYARNISFYEPMYFLVGIDPKNSKFQFSFKYRFFNSEKPLTREHAWVEGIHFAYTQTSFWDLAGDSQPFEDTSYKPEFFYRTRNIETGITRLKGFFLQTGLQHESNGLAGDSSRSTNFAYIAPIFVFFNAKDFTGIKISPRFQAYIKNDDQTNPDLPDYRGYWNLGLTAGTADGWIVDSDLRWADAGGSIQVDVTYPLHRIFPNNVDLYIQMEYVNALAESLLNYNERNEAVRIGLAIVR